MSDDVGEGLVVAGWPQTSSRSNPLDLPLPPLMMTMSPDLAKKKDMIYSLDAERFINFSLLDNKYFLAPALLFPLSSTSSVQERV
jgi:hypothetical protein